MRFRIVYDRFCRLRVRCAGFTREQGFAVEAALSGLPRVETVEANYRTAGILIMYQKGGRGDVIKALREMDIKQLATEPIPETVAADDEFRRQLTVMIAKKAVSRLFIPLPVRNIITLFRALKYVGKALDSLFDCRIDVAVLDGASVSASILTGDYSTASSVMFLLRLSDLLEEYTRKRTKLALSEQLALNVDRVWLKTEGEPVSVPFSQVKPGDKIIVYAGCVIPFDGTVVEGEAMVNQASMTGESEAVHKKADDSVFAGTAVEVGTPTILVKSAPDESRLSRIISLIDESEGLKAGVQSRAEKLADSIVPYSFLGFALSYAVTHNIQRALSVLMVDFSCAIKLSTPISVISAMREAAEGGAVVKGGKYLEAYAEADTMVFDKTGTLTNAAPKVTDIVPFNGYDRDYVLKTAACLEEHFPHSMASAVVKCAEEENLLHEEEHAEVEYLVAHGIVTRLNGERAVIGSAHFIFEDEGVPVTAEQREAIDERSVGKSSIFLAIGGKLAGMLVIDDPIRSDASEIIGRLRECGIKRICMLTGDAEPAAKRVAESLGLDMYISQVLPEHKCEYVKALKSNGHKVIMIGDGINDTPALAAADVSVAMGAGSDIARQVADIALTRDGLIQLVHLRRLSEALMKRINSNYGFIVGFNSALILLGISGIVTPAALALLHNGSTIIVSARSMTKLPNVETGLLK